MKISIFSSISIWFELTMALRQRNVLSLHDKIKVLEDVDTGKSRKWLSKEYNISESTLSKLIKSRNEIMRMKQDGKNLLRKKIRQPKYACINKAMSIWFEQMTEKTPFVLTEAQIKAKASQFAEKMGIVDFTANPGWIQRWKNNQNIQLNRIKRNAKAVASNITVSVEYFRNKILPDLLDSYAADEIYNIYETSLFYKALPKATEEDDPISCDTSKDRLTLFMLTNSLGTDRCAFAIGKYCHKPGQPSCNTAVKPQIPVKYKYNAKGWTTNGTWKEIIDDLDCMMIAKQKRILLFVTNSQQLKLDAEPKNIKMICVPQEVTNASMPFVEDLIQCVKVNFRMHLLREQALAAEGGFMDDFVKSINISKALDLVRLVWGHEVSAERIIDCFRNIAILDDVDVLIKYEEEEEEYQRQFLDSATNITNDDNNCKEEDDFLLSTAHNGIMSDDEILLHSVVNAEFEQEEDAVIEKPQRSEVLKALFTLKLYLGNDNKHIIALEDELLKTEC